MSVEDLFVCCENNFSLQGAKYLWLLPLRSNTQILELASRYNLPIPIIQAMVSRGIIQQEDIDSYLFSSPDRDIAHSSLLKDASKTVSRILHAIEHKERILIFGDYDVDGMSATAMVVYCLLLVGANVNFYLPNRMTEGYGLSVDAVIKAARNGYSLIMTVDNGITSFAAAEHAQKLGIDLIITDHHRPQEQLPKAFAIVNPLRHDCPYPCKILAGVGVAFKIMTLLFEALGKPIPEKAYEMLALGTIADVVPLKNENRYWVSYGLSCINKGKSLPFQVLKNNNKMSKDLLSALDIGFSIAPQINALGRLSDPRKGIAFLIGSDVRLVSEVGATLFELNEARKQVERSMLADIDVAIREHRIDLKSENIIVAGHTNWPVGVVGLVASRLVSLYGKPSLLFHCCDDGMARGSGRSISAFNLFEALSDNKDLLDHFGGHALAAGLSLPIDKISLLKDRLEERIATQLTPFDLQQKLKLDAELTLPELTRTFNDDLRRLEPFGNENEQPLFYIKKVVTVQEPLLLKDQHVKCHIFSDGIIKPIIFFNRPDLFGRLQALAGSPFDCAAYVTENHWNGNVNIELQGVDIA